MPGAARQFEPQITRSGGAPSKYRFTVRCSECSRTNSYEASKPVGDHAVRAYFRDHRWLLGRDRSCDMCPTCLAGSSRSRPQPQGGEAHRQNFTPPLAQSAASSDKRHHDTDDILARHLGNPKAMAAEVFRPKPPASSPTITPAAPQQQAPASALSAEVEQALIGMASDLKSLRSTVELMAQQMSNLVALGAQQIETTAQLAPVLRQSADGISSNLQEVVCAVKTIRTAAELTAEPQLAPEIAPEPKQIASSERPLVEVLEAAEPTQQARSSRKATDKSQSPVSGQVVVKSIADANRPNRFYTTVRLSRELWDRSGFGPADRIQMDWSGKTLSIRRAAEGGVKPKSIGDAVVVLQSWRLGDLNLDRTRVTSGTGSLRLTALR